MVKVLPTKGRMIVDHVDDPPHENSNSSFSHMPILRGRVNCVAVGNELSLDDVLAVESN